MKRVEGKTVLKLTGGEGLRTRRQNPHLLKNGGMLHSKNPPAFACLK
jgi:hypothetical protein